MEGRKVWRLCVERRGLENLNNYIYYLYILLIAYILYFYFAITLEREKRIKILNYLFWGRMRGGGEQDWKFPGRWDQMICLKTEKLLIIFKSKKFLFL